MPALVPADWMPNVSMQRIIMHWTAGGHKANSTDKKAYHILIEGDGTLVRGVASIALNSGTIKPGYAAHTLNCNSGSIGVSLCCMAGAKESPFNAGPYPMTKAQFDTLISVVKQLATHYKIPVTRQTILSHAEVQTTLGITQKNKWDYTRLAFDPSLQGALKIGDHIRSLLASSATTEELVVPVVPAGATAIVKTNGSPLVTRSSPKGASLGSLPNGTKVDILKQDGDWLLVKSPAGFQGWVDSQWISVIDGPQVEEEATPDPIRKNLNQIRSLLDDIEADL